MSNQAINPLNIPSLQVKNQVNFQQNPAGAQTSMQGIDRETVKQSVDNSYLANRAKASEDSNPLATLGLGTAVWYGLSKGMDKFNPKCEGAYRDSILGKLGSWGDNFSIKNPVGRRIEGSLRWLDKKLDALASKNKIVNALRNHSTRPEWDFARTPGAGLHGFLAMDTKNIMEEFLKPISGRQAKGIFGMPLGLKHNYYQGLEQYGKMTQQEINAFVDGLKGLKPAEKAMKLQLKELELLGADMGIAAKIQAKTGLTGLEKFARNLKIKKLGFKSLREYKEITEHLLDNPDKIMNALSKADKNIRVSIWRKHGTWGKIKNHLFGRTASLQEYHNKYLATLGKGNHTKLGRFLPKSLSWFLEGCTNRFAGGKLAVAMQAGIFADMLYHTIKAPKGEKGKTFAERFVNDFTYFLAMVAGIAVIHKIGGFKYLGIKNKAGVEAYRKGLEQFNFKRNAGLLGTKKAYKFAEKRLDVLLGKKNLNFFEKMLYKVGKFVNMGNERKLSYVSKSKINMNWLRKLANGNLLGVPLRVYIAMGMVSPFLAKFTTQLTHKIFGKPTNSVLDEDKEPQELQQPQQNQTQDNIQQIQKHTFNHRNPNEYSSDTNLIKMRANGQATGVNGVNGVNGTQQTQQTAQSNAKQETKDNKTEQEPVRTYIPSPVGMVPQGPDMSAYNQAIAQVDAAEQYAQSVLKKN